MILLATNSSGECSKIDSKIPPGFPLPNRDVICFIGTVENSISPVFGISTEQDPVSLITFNIEESLIGNADGQEIVSYGTIYFSKKKNTVVSTFGSTGFWTYLKPGQRAFVLAYRRNAEDARTRGYLFGGRYLISFVRILPNAREKTGTVLKIIDVDCTDAIKAYAGSRIQNMKVDPQSFVIKTEVDDLDLETLRLYVAKLYGGNQ